MLLRLIFCCSLTFGLFAQKSESSIRPSMWLGIWDNVKHVPSMNVTAIGYNDIPRDINFKGTLVEVLEFDDANGHNLLILTQTGMFPVSKKDETGKYVKQHDRAELFAYCLVRNDEKSTYRQLWKLADAENCEGFDLYVGFTKNAMSITDLDGDGVAEVTFQYLKSCRSDVSPADRFLTLFESNEKYQVKGATQLEGMPLDPPLFDARTEGNATFKTHFLQKWEQFAADDFIQFTYE
jgi:hypothetical protein